MTRPFEPEDIVRLYRKHNLRPCSVRFGLEVTINEETKERTLSAPAGGHVCPLSILVVGELPKCIAVGDSVITMIRQRFPEFDSWGFIYQFDNLDWNRRVGRPTTPVECHDGLARGLATDTFNVLVSEFSAVWE